MNVFDSMGVRGTWFTCPLDLLYISTLFLLFYCCDVSIRRTGSCETTAQEKINLKKKTKFSITNKPRTKLVPEFWSGAVSNSGRTLVGVTTMGTVKAKTVMKRFAVSQCEEGKTLISAYLYISHLEKAVPGTQQQLKSLR